jgi:drug/metabolite transporter (DMT)-like permease
MSTRRGFAFALAGAASGGAFVVPWKLAAEQGDQSAMVLVMLGVAAILNTLLLPFLPPPAENTPPRSRRLLLFLGAAIAVLTLAGNSATAAAITHLSAPLVSVILRSDVLVTALLGLLFLGERTSLRFWFGALIAGAGLWIAQSPSTEQLGSPIGVLICISAAVAFSGIGVLTRRYIQQVDALALNAVRLWLSVLLWFCVYGFALPSGLTTEVIVYASLAALVGPGLGRVCLMLSARDLEARWTAMLGLTGPVWALVFTAIFLRDLPTSSELIGGSILLLGISYAAIARSR